jgi:hypothetical protein
MECLGLHNKPKAEVQPEHKLTGPKEEEEEVLYILILKFLDSKLEGKRSCTE